MIYQSESVYTLKGDYTLQTAKSEKDDKRLYIDIQNCKFLTLMMLFYFLIG